VFGHGRVFAALFSRFRTVQLKNFDVTKTRTKKFL